MAALYASCCAVRLPSGGVLSSVSADVRSVVVVHRVCIRRLVTFDGDCTLYSDGNNFAEHKLARNICLLLRRGVTCALVTAAGYGYKAER